MKKNSEHTGIPMATFNNCEILLYCFICTHTKTTIEELKYLKLYHVIPLYPKILNKYTQIIS